MLRHYREAAGLSQEDLAERAELTVQAVGALERGHRRTPYPATVRRLAAALGLGDAELAALMAARGEMKAPPTPSPAAVPDATAPLELPQYLEPLIGREREREALIELLGQPEVRLLTLTGPGGVGKTRLAISVARRAAALFPDGTAFVPLAPLTDPNLMLPTVVQALGLRESAERAPRDVLQGFLRDRQMLLLLDNLEHLLDAALDIGELLLACPQLTVLATSRAPLRLRGERTYVVPPLSLPAVSRDLPLEAVARTDAVALFVRCARQSTPAFALTTANAPAVAAICRRLDGLPLAIELAAARVRLLPPKGLLERLDRALPLLSGGARDLPARQRTMRDAIAWSHDLLDPVEQLLFTRLAVFVGGWTIEAAEAVAATPNGEDDRPVADVLTGLAALLERNLLTRAGTGEAGPRFGMLEMIRAYALERLAASGEEEAIRDQHAAYFLALAERGGGMPVGRDQGIWLEDLESEGGNLRAAADWFIARGDAPRALRLGGALWWFWYIRSHLTEGRARLAAALALPGAETSDPARVGALLGAGTLAWRQGDLDTALLRCEESAALARRLGDERATAWALVFRGHILGDQGELAAARRQGAEALQLFRAVGDKAGLARALNGAGEDAQITGDYARAEALYEECLALDRELGDTVGIVLRQHNLGYVALRRGEGRRARDLFRQGLLSSQALHYSRGVALCLAGLAAVAITERQPSLGLTLYGVSAGLREAIGEVEDLVNRAENEHYIALARAALGPDRAAAAWATGRASAPDEGIALALGTADESAAPSA